MKKLLPFFGVVAALCAAIAHLPSLRAFTSFTQGDLVIYRVGTGGASLSSAATAVFLDEYTPAGTLVQSIAMPTAPDGSNRQFTASGTATTEGFLTRSADGNFIVAPGYDAAPGTTSITTSLSTTVNRVVARIGASGVPDTSTATTAFSGGNPRSVASNDGSQFWLAGSNSGVLTVPYGAPVPTSPTVVSTTQTNLREMSIFGGQLYATTGAGAAFRVGTVGSGLPTTANQTTTSLPGVPPGTGAANGVFFADLSPAVAGFDTLYIADDSANVLFKYSLVGGTWTANASISVSAARGLTGVVTGTTVTLYGTTGSTLYSFTDASGYNAPISGTTTTLVTAPTNTAFRGVALTPINSLPPTPTNPTGVYTANPNPVQAGGSTTLKVQVTPGTNPPSQNLSVTSDLTAIGIPGVQTFIAGANNAFTFTASVPGSVTPGDKTLTATVSDTNPEHTSTTASLTLTVSAAATSPTGVGSASPASVRANDSTLLKVTVTPGSNPPSTGLTVLANLTAIGGSSSQPFTLANGNDYTFTATVAAATTVGPKSLPVTVSDAQGRSTTTSIALTIIPPPPPTTVKISQVYGGGGNSGSTYTNDFIELFNADTNAIDVTGWAVQYAGATITGAWQVTEICPSGPCVIEPGHYFLVEESQGANGTTPLPIPNASGTILMSATQAKVAVTNTAVPISGACPVAGTVADLVGYGGANCAEISAAPVLTNTTAAIRRGNGCQDSDNNAADFVTAGPIPRNSLAPPQTCGGDPTQPSGLGIATPDSVLPASNTLLTVRVTPATAPPSTGLSVVGDLRNIGGSATQALYDDGTHGDQVAGDNVFSFETTVGAAVTTGAKYLVATVADQAHSVTVPITITIQSPTCGVERWVVKVGTDTTVGQVRLDIPPTPATVLELGQMPAPPESDIDTGGQFATTRDAPVETTVYQIDATMTFYKLETDVDYHIVVDDGQGHTLITEIPNPACILAPNPNGPGRILVDSPLGPGIANAREQFDARLTPQTFFQTANLPVRVRGVGFFDFEHGQTGVAPNAIELHPVLDLFFRANTTTTLTATGTPTFGEPITFTATVTNGGTPAPTGHVTFFDAGSSFTVALDGNGQASYSTTSLAAGSHSITASYDGDDTDLPSQSAAFVIDIAKADQSIAFAPLADKSFGDAPFVVSASGGASGNPVTFTATGACTASGVNGSTITLTTVGSCTVTASQAGNNNYNDATPVSRTFAIHDVRPPTITRVVPSVTSIWPPNKRMVPVTVSITATDDVDTAPACQVLSVSANEGSPSDAVVTGPTTVSLRADRLGVGDGRVYTITVRCTDVSGNASTATTKVTVPHDQGR